jgi:hypothetical protein
MRRQPTGHGQSGCGGLEAIPFDPGEASSQYRGNNGRADSVRCLPVAIDWPELTQSLRPFIWRDDDFYSRRNLV